MSIWMSVTCVFVTVSPRRKRPVMPVWEAVTTAGSRDGAPERRRNAGDRPAVDSLLGRGDRGTSVLPPGHAAVGYLAARATGRRPEGVALAALLVGTQLPDAIDKPLAWYAGVFPYGRAFGHAIVAAVVVSAVALGLWWIERRDGSGDRAALGGLVVIGYWSHLVGDTYSLVLGGDFGEASFLLYPLVALPIPEGETGLLASLAGSVTPWLLVEGVAVVAALWLWWSERTSNSNRSAGWDGA